MSEKRIRFYLTVVLGALILTVLVGFTDAFTTVSKGLDDLVFRSPSTVDTRIKIIALDEKTHLMHENPHQDYLLLAKLVEILHEKDVAVIGLNIYLPSSGDPSQDKILEEKIWLSDRVIMPVYPSGPFGGAGTQNLISPFEGFARRAKLGLKLVRTDSDSVLRRAFIKTTADDVEVQSFSYQIFNRFLDRTGAESLWKEGDFTQGHMLIDFVAGNDYLEVISAADILSGNVADEYLKGTIVLVGEWLPGTERYMTPLRGQGFLYDTAVEANILQQLINGRKLTVVHPGVRFGLMIILATAVAMIISHFNLIPGMGAVLLLSFAVYQANSLYFITAGIMNPVLEPITGMAFAFVISAGYTVVEDRVRATEKFLNSLIDVMVTQIETQTKYNADHTKRVKELALKIAEGLPRMDRGARQVLGMAASLHDVGKIGVPASILNKSTRLGEEFFKVLNQIEQEKCRLIMVQAEKEHLKKDVVDRIGQCYSAYREMVERLNNPNEMHTEQDMKMLESMANNESGALLNKQQYECLLLIRGTLTNDERKAVEEHVNHTQKYLSYVRFPGAYQRVPEIVAKHHEKLNGTGYPAGLKGDDIPLEARILQIADIADAILASDRPYKEEYSWEHCGDIMERMAANGEIDGGIFKTIKDRDLLRWHAEYLEKNSLVNTEVI